MMDGKSIRQKLIGTDDERAVSPVIGVILMVAITVILAAVIAAFVLDMGQSVQSDVQAAATIESDSSNDRVTVTFTSAQEDDTELLVDVHNISSGNTEATDHPLPNIGDTKSWDLQDTKEYRVVVVAQNGDRNTTVQTKEFQL